MDHSHHHHLDLDPTNYSFIEGDDHPTLQRLDQHSISLLRSGVYLPSFTHTLKSLIEISIRSNPTTISVSIDPQSGTICVDDNGIGIDKRLVNLLGRFDSKSLVCSPPTSNQSSGGQIISYLSPSQHRVLDSLAHLSLLDICSRQADATHTHQTLFREGQVIFSAPARTSRRQNCGTTTTVRDLYYNLPIRQMRETDPIRLEQRLKRQWEECRITLQSLAIVHPYITFSLRNSSHQSLIGCNPSDSTSFYRISKTRSSINTFGKIFGQRFVQYSTTFNLTIDNFQVSGLFSKQRHSSKAIQLIYLDRVLVGANSLAHKNLIDLFSKRPLLNLSSCSSGVDRNSVSTEINPTSKGATSSVDRHPVFLLLFTSLQNAHGSCTTSALNFFEGTGHCLMPQVEDKMSRVVSQLFSKVFPNINGVDSSSRSPSTSRKDSSGKKTLHSHGTIVKRPRLSNISPACPLETRPNFSSSSNLQCHAGKELENFPQFRIKNTPSTSKSSSSTVIRTKLRTKSVDSHCYTPKAATSLLSKDRSYYPRAISDLKSRFEYKPHVRPCTKNTNTDFYDFGKFTSVNYQPQNNQEQRKQLRPDFGPAATNDEETELRIDLSKLLKDPSQFTVVGQLDLKFIIVKVEAGNDSNGSILAFDQHAVHERIRIERYLQEICSGNFQVKKLKTSIDQELDGQVPRAFSSHRDEHQDSVPILVSRSEHDGFLKFQNHFNRWGFVYTFKSVNQTFFKPRSSEIDNEDEEEAQDEFKQIFMMAIPELIWSRIQCDDSGLKLLGSILRGCLGFFEDRNRDRSLNSSNPSSLHHNSHHTHSNSDWFGFVKDCPTVLIDLLNSKACRGSIMFGDELTNEESKRLLIKLSRTRLPFSCAHGRPTCHPLYRFPRTFKSSTKSSNNCDGARTLSFETLDTSTTIHPSLSPSSRLLKDSELNHILHQNGDHSLVQHYRNRPFDHQPSTRLKNFDDYHYHQRKINWELLAL